MDHWEKKPLKFFNGNPSIFIQENAFENVVCKMVAILCGLNALNHWEIKLVGLGERGITADHQQWSFASLMTTHVSIMSLY